MREKPDQLVEQYRVTDGAYASPAGANYGAFILRAKPTGAVIQVIASDGSDDVPWEHVSVSAKNRCPTWEEMCWVKSLFWSAAEAVIQYHPPESEYVNNHRFCLHMWRPTECDIPLPPSIAVGFKQLETVLG